MKLNGRFSIFVLLLLFPLLCFAELSIVVKGLFKNGAILEVNGKQRLVKQGKKTPEGIVLVEANSQFALVNIAGEEKKLYLSKQISSTFSDAEKKEVRINSGQYGHFYSTGYINGLPIKFVVDTGASSIAMNSKIAKKLGIRYELGRRMSVSTANGVVRAYKINLRSVSVGGIKLENVEGSVLDGDHPQDILLGNTFLSRINYKVEGGVLILETKY